ncbi:MAG: DUF1631 family protein [Pseudomonadales bacterium]|nr:DUF1631 family protein [Pseudomonadales bacterium]MCP5346673.1 DUF1631 family protein [Pseudomonadales bacterium]
MTQLYNQIIQQVRDTAATTLAELADNALRHASLVLNQQHKFTGDDEKLIRERANVISRFTKQITFRFDKILDGGLHRHREGPDFSGLSLMETDVQDANIALEGMAVHARNTHTNELLRFAVRVNAQFFSAQLDESNNPLDPAIIADAFKNALSPVGLSAAALTDVYRQFNLHLFHKLEAVLGTANQIVASTGLRPTLENLGRTKKAIANRRIEPRSRLDANTRAFRVTEQIPERDESASRPLLDIVVGYLRRCDAAGLASVTVPDSQSANQTTQVLDRKQLAQMLAARTAPEDAFADSEQFSSLSSVAERVKEILNSDSTADQQLRLNQRCSDIVSLVSLLFTAVSRDEILADTPRALLTQTWLTVLQVALAGPGFFDNAGHPIRALLNEFAAASIGWTPEDQLQDEPVYQRARETILKVTNNFQGDLRRVDALVQDFLAFKRQQVKEKSGTPSHLLSSTESKQRLRDLHSYALRKIAERIPDQSTPPLVRDILEKYYSVFLVKVLRRDGPGGEIWKPVMDTLDVLLWSVTPGKTGEDAKRFGRVRERLMANLANALKIAGMERQQSDRVLKELKELQQQCFSQRLPASAATAMAKESPIRQSSKEVKVSVSLDNTSGLEPQLEVVKNLAIGVWLEFDVHENQPIRCTLASRIPSINRLIFVNRKGVKVIDRTEQEVAVELLNQSARLIDAGRLMDRSFEAVIAELRSLG